MSSRLIDRERPVANVLSDIVHNLQEIVRFEIRLAKTEVREQAERARYCAVLIATGIIGGVLSLLFLCVAALLALSVFIPAWGAAVCVAGAAGLVAIGSFKLAMRRLKRVQPLPKTANSLKENFQWRQPSRYKPSLKVSAATYSPTSKSSKTRSDQ